MKKLLKTLSQFLGNVFTILALGILMVLFSLVCQGSPGSQK